MFMGISCLWASPVYGHLLFMGISCSKFNRSRQKNVGNMGKHSFVPQDKRRLSGHRFPRNQNWITSLCGDFSMPNFIHIHQEIWKVGVDFFL
jgi:hypothetical protein